MATTTQFVKLQQVLAPAVARTPEKIAIRCGSRHVSFAELESLSRKAAGGLLARGVQQGDRVALLLPNCLEFVITTLACYKIGAVVVPLNYRYLAEETSYVLEHTWPTLCVCHEARLEIAAAVMPPETTLIVGDSPAEPLADWSSLLNGEPLERDFEVDAGAAALILYTSGSTGRPKGVVHSHAGAFWAIDISRRVFDFQPRDVVLVGKPISHAGGLQTQLFPALAAGAESILAMKPSPAEAVELLSRFGGTQYGLLSSDLLDFVEYLEGHPAGLPSLVNSIGSGDSVPVDLHHRFRDLFGWEVMEGCGMTEVGMYYAVNPRYGQRKWGSLGLPPPDVALRVVDGEGRQVPNGEVGQVEVRSPSATIGYWQNDEATAELLQNGWLKTGDLAHRDEDGYFWFAGRSKLIIVRRGSNISPNRVEDVLDEHPQVRASVVVGVPDARDGHVPFACVAPLDPAHPPSADALRAFVASHLAAYEVPAGFLLLDELPRNATGKFDRHKLQTLAVQKAAGEET